MTTWANLALAASYYGLTVATRKSRLASVLSSRVVSNKGRAKVKRQRSKKKELATAISFLGSKAASSKKNKRNLYKNH